MDLHHGWAHLYQATLRADDAREAPNPSTRKACMSAVLCAWQVGRVTAAPLEDVETFRGACVWHACVVCRGAEPDELAALRATMPADLLERVEAEDD